MGTQINKGLQTLRLTPQNSERGISLISTCIMIMVIGLLMSAVMSFYNIGQNFKAEAKTQTNLNLARRALELHNAMHGRFPCPAPINATVDSAGFGLEVGSDCTLAPVISGETFRVKGRDDRLVRIGALPIRTLNIDDNLMFDGHDRRLIYAITEEYAADGTSVSGDRGAITIQDRSANIATSIEGNGIFVLLSPGRDGNGAYSFNGGLLQACDASKASGENCDFQISTISDAVFTSSTQADANEADPFLHQSTYMSSEVPACPYERKFEHHFFYVQPDRRPAKTEDCPPGYTRCTVGDIVYWALHRIIPQVIEEKRAEQAEKNGRFDLFPSRHGTYKRGWTFLTSPLDGGAEYVHPNPTIQSNHRKSERKLFGDYKYASLGRWGGFGHRIHLDVPFYSNHIAFPNSPAKEFERRIPLLCNGDGRSFGDNLEHAINLAWSPESINKTGGTHPTRSERQHLISGRGPFTRTDKFIVIANNAYDGGAPGFSKSFEDVMKNAALMAVLEKHVELDVIDIRSISSVTEHDSTTKKFKQLASAGGGQYYNVNDAEELLEILRKSAGTCELYDPTIDGGAAAATRSYCK